MQRRVAVAREQAATIPLWNSGQAASSGPDASPALDLAIELDYPQSAWYLAPDDLPS